MESMVGEGTVLALAKDKKTAKNLYSTRYSAGFMFLSVGGIVNRVLRAELIWRRARPTTELTGEMADRAKT